jgi:uncharacterized membrane protein YqaE (UPF0057 family)
VTYLLAIILPPIALFSVGKIGQGILCTLLMFTVIGWPIAAVWALLVVHDEFGKWNQQRANEDLAHALANAGQPADRSSPPLSPESLTSLATCAGCKRINDQVVTFAGERRCMYCSEAFVPLEQPPGESTMRQCPFCESSISGTAQKCRFCGDWVNEATSLSPE